MGVSMLFLQLRPTGTPVRLKNPDYLGLKTQTSHDHSLKNARWAWWGSQNITIKNHKNISAYVRLYNFEIRVGHDDTDFTQNALCYYHPDVVGDGATEDFPCLYPQRGRYISIQRLYPFGSLDETLTLCEVQIFQTGTQETLSRMGLKVIWYGRWCHMNMINMYHEISFQCFCFKDNSKNYTVNHFAYKALKIG